MPELVVKRTFFDGSLHNAGETIKVSDSDIKRWEADGVKDKGNGKLAWMNAVLNHCGWPLPKEAQKDMDKDAKSKVFGPK